MFRRKHASFFSYKQSVQEVFNSLTMTFLILQFLSVNLDCGRHYAGQQERIGLSKRTDDLSIVIVPFGKLKM